MGCGGKPGKPGRFAKAITVPYSGRDEDAAISERDCDGCEDCAPITVNEPEVRQWLYQYDGDSTQSARMRALCESWLALRNERDELLTANIVLRGDSEERDRLRESLARCRDVLREVLDSPAFTGVFAGAEGAWKVRDVLPDLIGKWARNLLAGRAWDGSVE